MTRQSQENPAADEIPGYRKAAPDVEPSTGWDNDPGPLNWPNNQPTGCLQPGRGGAVAVMDLLDTNVVSELLRPRPHGSAGLA